MKTRQAQFVKVIEEHAGILHKVCRIYQSSIGYDDLYQEIVIQLWKSFGSFKGNSKISTWIYRVAINTAITFFKKKKIELSEIDSSHCKVEETDKYDTEKFEQRPTYVIMTVFGFIAMMFFVEYSAKKCTGNTLHN